MTSSEFVRCRECHALNDSRALFCTRCGAHLWGRFPEQDRRRGRRVTAASAVRGFALLLVLAAVVFALYAIVRQALDREDDLAANARQTGAMATLSTTTTVKGPAGDASASSTAQATLVRPKAVTASSALRASSTNDYRATNLLDGDLETAWSEGADGPGAGEWVRFEFSQQVTLSRIEIANGYQKDEDRFFGNPRVRSLQVEYSTGSTQLVTLLDTKEFQVIVPTRQPVEWVKLTIVSVYPGDKWDDTSLSEVRIYATAH